ncbi:MAG: DNRLRE domain-containing protein [Candidatus Peribacteraceae bacterium]|nr:DNRLRE domain-containing protein [Candidatus Peribacteraceae bacterium]
MKKNVLLSILISAIIIIGLFVGIFYLKGGLTGFVVSNIGMTEDADYKDGYVRYNTGTLEYLKIYESDTTMLTGSTSVSNLVYRTYIDFNIAAIPDDATINSVSVKLYINSNDANNVYIYGLSGKSTTFTDANLYTECGGDGSSTQYVSASSAFNSLADTESATVDLGSSAVTALSNQLGSDWFSIGIKSAVEDDNNKKEFYSSNHGSYDPELVVDYTGAASSNNAPTVSVSTSNETSFENTHSATVTYTSTDDTNLTLNCTLYFDSVLNQSQISTAASSDTFAIGGLEIGTYIYYVNCSEISENHDGLWNASNELTFHINDTAAPVITLLSPANGYNTTSTKIDLNFSVTDTFVTEVICNLTIDGETLDAITTDTGLVKNFTRTLAAGTHQWNISCNDTGDNVGYSSTRSLTVDVFAPKILIIAPVNNTINQTDHNITFSYSASDNITGIKNCSLIINGNITTTNYEGEDFTDVSFVNGYYNWSINCTDFVGNMHSNGTYVLNISNYDWDNDSHNNSAYGGNDCNDYSYSTTVYTGASCTRSGYTGSTYDSSCSCTGGTLTGSGTGGSSSGGDDTSDEATEEEPPAEEQDDIVNDEPEQETEDTQEEDNTQGEPVTVQTRIDNWVAESGSVTSSASVSSSVNISKNVTVKDNKTLIDLIVVPEENIVNFSYYEDIPKCAIELIKAGYINESVIKFHNPDFTIVDEDPLLMWQFDIVRAREAIDLSYEISKEILDDCIEKLEYVGVTFGEINVDRKSPPPKLFESVKLLSRNIADFFKEKTATAIIGTIAGFMLLAFAGMQIKVRGSVEKKLKKELFGKKATHKKARKQKK